MDNSKVLERIKSAIEKIEKKENNIFFFVIDTKGNPSGSLEYIYNLANFIQEDGYNVTMLYEVGKDEEFVGVKDWLGAPYSELKHLNVTSEDLSISPSDVLFIPEIFANLMVKTKNLPCKRIAILQNYDYMVEQIPMGTQWGDLGIMECITNTSYNAQLINNIFPYVKTTVIPPYINDLFGTTSEPKQMLINVVAKNQSDINRLVKPFYWKYPMYKWVSFVELRGMSKEEFAKSLRENAITIWLDEDSSFGYTALEAMKSGNIVLGKITNNEMPWVNDKEGKILDGCIWFNNFEQAHHMLANVIRAEITNTVPKKIYEDSKKTLEPYTKENTRESILTYFHNVLEERKSEMEKLLNKVEK